MLALLARRHQRVDLVEEDHRGLLLACDLEQRLQSIDRRYSDQRCIITPSTKSSLLQRTQVDRPIYPPNYPPTYLPTFISFSPSPMYLLVTLEEEIEKKLNWDSVATALASRVLPVPGGPNSSTPGNAMQCIHHTHSTAGQCDLLFLPHL